MVQYMDGLEIKEGEVGLRTARNTTPLMVSSSGYKLYSFPLSLVSLCAPDRAFLTVLFNVR